MMWNKFFLFLGLSAISMLVNAEPNRDLCTQFVPASNKQFVDTFASNFLYVTRSGTKTGSKITGTFQHVFGGNNAPTAHITGSCGNNLLSFSWSESKSFYGQFSGTLQCMNGIYNLINVLAVVNNVPVEIPAMVSPASGACPKT